MEGWEVEDAEKQSLGEKAAKDEEFERTRQVVQRVIEQAMKTKKEKKEKKRGGFVVFGCVEGEEITVTIISYYDEILFIHSFLISLLPLFFFFFFLNLFSSNKAKPSYGEAYYVRMGKFRRRLFMGLVGNIL